MIKSLLIKPRTFAELHECLKSTHTEQSLKIELDFFVEIGKVFLVGNKYKLLK